MASPAATTAARAVAPWRAQFLEHTGKMDQASFTFTSLHSSQGTGSAPTVPRARTCILRGMWASLPENKHNDAPRNPEIYESDMPAFTTDARMQKVPEIFGSEPSTGSGGGAPVEGMWWVTETQTQWRIRGTAWVLGPDIDSEAGKPARDAVGRRMRKTVDAGKDAGLAEQWSWAKEVTGHFGNCSPGMRGTFKNPPPGTPRAVPGGEGEGIGQKVEDLSDPLARKNFRVVVIVPNEVDQTDLSDPADPRRWLFTYVGPASESVHKGGEIIDEWEKVELWP